MADLLWEEVILARKRIAPFAHRTPFLTCTSLDRAAANNAFFKCECLQKSGSFKFRGACNAIAALTATERTRGVITHSSGNHAQALALAARLHHARATVVVPEDATGIKRLATAGYGANVVLCKPNLAARAKVTAQIVKETGAIFVSSHDDNQVIAGQGTAAAELIEDVGDLDYVLVPVGGGGLLAGTAITASHLLPKARVIGCEPAEADDAYRSFRGGKRVEEVSTNTIADGLRTTLGVRNFEVIKSRVFDIVRVSEEEIIGAMRYVWERMKIVIEPSSAVAVAPLLYHHLGIEGKKVGVILSGGNVDLEPFFQAILDSSRRKKGKQNPLVSDLLP